MTWSPSTYTCTTCHPKSSDTRVDTRVRFDVLSHSRVERCQLKALDGSTSRHVLAMALSKQMETISNLRSMPKPKVQLCIHTAELTHESLICLHEELKTSWVGHSKNCINTTEYHACSGGLVHVQNFCQIRHTCFPSAELYSPPSKRFQSHNTKPSE